MIVIVLIILNIFAIVFYLSHKRDLPIDQDQNVENNIEPKIEPFSFDEQPIVEQGNEIELPKININ